MNEYGIYFRNGAERSGLFCVALYVAQQIKTQQKVDIFSAVKHVRLYRHLCISNMVRFFTFLSLFCTFRKGPRKFGIIRFCFTLFQEQYIVLHEFARECIKRRN